MRAKDDRVAEQIDPAEPVNDGARRGHPAAINPAEPADPSISEPPKPVKPTDESLAHVHSVLEQIVAAMQVLAAQVPTGHGMQAHFSGIRDSLAALFDRAHSK